MWVEFRFCILGVVVFGSDDLDVCLRGWVLMLISGGNACLGCGFLVEKEGWCGVDACLCVLGQWCDNGVLEWLINYVLWLGTVATWVFWILNM